MAELVAAFTDFAVFGQDAIQGSDRAKRDALVEQGGIDLGGGLVDEPGGSQNIAHTAAFFRAKAARWRVPDGLCGERPEQACAGAIDAGAGQSESGAGACHEAAARGQGDGGPHHEISSHSAVAIGIPSKAATFFDSDDRFGVFKPLTQPGVFAAKLAEVGIRGLGEHGLGPRRSGLSASNAPASRWRRHSVRADE